MFQVGDGEGHGAIVRDTGGSHKGKALRIPSTQTSS